MHHFIVCTILFFCGSTVIYGQKYQVNFVEGGFKTTSKIPQRVFRDLKKDSSVQECVSYTNSREFSINWFKATKINLNNDRFPDLLIQGTPNCLSGNAISFWFFTNNHGVYKQVLFDYTIVINISNKKTNGFYNIETLRSAGMETFINKNIFNGRTYFKKGRYSVPFIH